MRGEKCTAEEVRRRSLSCQRQRQRLLRAAVENSTSRWAQRVFSARCSLPELAHLWRQHADADADFEAFAQRVVRDSRSPLRAPSGTSVGSSRRSASEPRLRHPAPAAASVAPPPAHRKRRHSIAVPLLPAALYGPYFYVAHPISQPVLHARVPADPINRTQMPKRGGQQTQQGYAAENMRPMRVVPHAVPVWLLCNVGVPADGQWAASFATRQDSATRAQTADKSTQTERRHSTGCRDSLRHSPRGHVAPAAVTQSHHRRSRTLPGNFAELEKTWDCNEGSPIKLPSKTIRL